MAATPAEVIAPARRSSSTVAQDGRIPIVIGVTGHRHLRSADLPGYRAKVRELFAELRARYRSTPLRILSALAAGADRLVAEVALEEGHELLVPLPLKPDDYERDFPDSAGQFHALVQSLPPESVFVLPVEAGVDGDRSVELTARERLYREAGIYIARHCHVLVALWDGQPSDSNVGTAAVVRLKLEGPAGLLPHDLRALDADDSGPVFHIHASREGDAANASGSAAWRYPPGGDESQFHLFCSRLERFNSERARRAVSSGVAGVARSLLPESEISSSSDRALARTFAAADLLAGHYQRLTRRVLRLTLVLAALLAIAFELYAEVLPSRGLPAAYLAIFAVLTLLLVWQRRRDVQGRYLDYRALAEGLRVQFYWRQAGLSDGVASSYLRKQLDELRWIREALRAASALPPPQSARPELAIRHWVAGQTRYYTEHARAQRRRLHWLERCARGFLVAGLVATASLVAFWGPLERLQHWREWIVVTMGFAPIGAALWETYEARFGIRTQLNQFARFAGIFQRAGRFAERIAEMQSASARHHALVALLRELGREALMENGDWVLLLRDRPIVLPKG
ncbi:MAG: DUF4231 domain-containing protein [Steroidobacteraceae bacterium]